MKHKVVAVTGGIGSGKSSVAYILQEMGFSVIFCDKLAAEAANDADLLNKVRLLLGEWCVTDGKLNRKAVREKVFNSDELYDEYSRLFWRHTELRLLEEVDLAETEAVFVEIPVLSAFDFEWYEIWLVESDREVCVQRAVSRDGVSVKNILSIMARQPVCQKYTRKIPNYGSLNDLKTQVAEALRAAEIE